MVFGRIKCLLKGDKFEFGFGDLWSGE